MVVDHIKPYRAISGGLQCPSAHLRTRRARGSAARSIDARYLAAKLKGECRGDRISCPGPGHSARDRSLSVLLVPDAPDGFIVHSFAGDDPMVCREHVAAALGRAPAAIREGRGPLPPATACGGSRARGKPPAQRWQKMRSARGTPAEIYLRSRCLEMPPQLDLVSLAFNPNACRTTTGSGTQEFTFGPAMAAAYRDFTTGEVRTIQQTFLTYEGRKLLGPDCKTLRRFTAGSSPKGAACKLDPIGPRLLVCEGVETGLAARQLGMKPVWVLGSKTLIQCFPVIDGVEEIAFLGENDGGGSPAAIGICAKRWRGAGRRATLYSPDPKFKDFNDAIMGVAHNGR
jgi:putative DNA primase/helicase